MPYNKLFPLLQELLHHEPDLSERLVTEIKNYFDMMTDIIDEDHVRGKEVVIYDEKEFLWLQEELKEIMKHSKMLAKSLVKKEWTNSFEAGLAENLNNQIHEFQKSLTDVLFKNSITTVTESENEGVKILQDLGLSMEIIYLCNNAKIDFVDVKQNDDEFYLDKPFIAIDEVETIPNKVHYRGFVHAHNSSVKSIEDWCKFDKLATFDNSSLEVIWKNVYCWSIFVARGTKVKEILEWFHTENNAYFDNSLIESFHPNFHIWWNLYLRNISHKFTPDELEVIQWNVKWKVILE